MKLVLLTASELSASQQLKYKSAQTEFLVNVWCVLGVMVDNVKLLEVNEKHLGSKSTFVTSFTAVRDFEPELCSTCVYGILVSYHLYINSEAV